MGAIINFLVFRHVKTYNIIVSDKDLAEGPFAQHNVESTASLLIPVCCFVWWPRSLAGFVSQQAIADPPPPRGSQNSVFSDVRGWQCGTSQGHRRAG